MTALEKVQKQKRIALLSISNKIKSQFSFGTVKLWSDVYRMQGLAESEINEMSDKDRPLTFKELKDYLERLRINQEAGFINEQVTKEEPAQALVEPLIVTEGNDESGIHNSENYGLPLFPGLKAFLFWFQKKACKAMLDNALGFDVSICKDVDELKAEWIRRGRKMGKMRGQLLLASTGTGKTFMAGAFVAYLHYIGFTTDKTFGPIEYLYVTRASIVTQTKRVFEQQFGLSVKDGVEILNVEQLRSKAGQLWVIEKTVVVNGEDQIIRTWRNGMHPVVMLLDESQAYKNDSTQSDIIQSYADLPVSETHTVCISATPFTRVSEAKSFVLNCHIDDRNLL